MKYVILLEDNLDAGPDIRTLHMPDHLRFLEKYPANIDAAGPLFENDGNGAGGLWIVNADSETEVQKLIEEDPFWVTGLRKSVRVLSWTQVFAQGRRLIHQKSSTAVDD